MLFLEIKFKEFYETIHFGAVARLASPELAEKVTKQYVTIDPTRPYAMHVGKTVLTDEHARLAMAVQREIPDGNPERNFDITA